MERLENKVALITGAARGIGKAHAELFAKEGAHVVITDINPAQGEKLADSIVADGGEAIFLKLDVRLEKDWADAIDQVLKKYGKLNVLVNNAGVSVGGTVEDTSMEDWNWIMDVNAKGVFLGIKYAIKAMKENGEKCSIINISSMDAIIGESGVAAYSASKGAVRSLTKASALACAEAGYSIRVNSVHPGYVNTEMQVEEAKGLGISVEEYRDMATRLHPIGYLGETIDIAYLSVYLASDESRWVTGSEYVIDGGYTAK
ncbi:glucose 1-dehydrogenase [Bacteroidota bacterium]